MIGQIVTVHVGWLIVLGSLILSAGIVIGALVVERAEDSIDRQMEADRQRVRGRKP